MEENKKSDIWFVAKTNLLTRFIIFNLICRNFGHRILKISDKQIKNNYPEFGGECKRCKAYLLKETVRNQNLKKLL